MANIITSIRILAALVLVFTEPLSAAFFAFYLLGGLSDMIDGTVARIRGEASLFGSRLDTIADALFLLSAFIRLLPVLEFPLFVWIGIALIALIKLLGIILSRGVVAEHTLLNKVAGGMIYLIPFVLSFESVIVYLLFVLALSAVASGQELYLVFKKAKK